MPLVPIWNHALRKTSTSSFLCSEENSVAVFRGLAAFGAPLAGHDPSIFNDRSTYFQMGEPPLRVDILQVLSGVDFEECWRKRQIGLVNGGFEVPVISSEHLIANKRAAGRPRDLLDLSDMERKRHLLKRFEPTE